jgi:GTP cyclohydrolase I
MPDGKLAGFSRVADLVECLTKRLTLQERATYQIAQTMWRGLGARGAGCVMQAEQLCLALRGERHSQSRVVTAAFVGEMDRRADLKAELYRASGEGPAQQEQG